MIAESSNQVSFELEIGSPMAQREFQRFAGGTCEFHHEFYVHDNLGGLKSASLSRFPQDFRSMDLDCDLELVCTVGICESHHEFFVHDSQGGALRPTCSPKCPLMTIARCDQHDDHPCGQPNIDGLRKQRNFTAVGHKNKVLALCVIGKSGTSKKEKCAMCPTSGCIN